jgi:hypothetical protein
MTSSSSRSRYLLALDRMIESVQHDVRDLAPGNFNTRDFLSGELKGLRAARAYAEAEEARIALSEIQRVGTIGHVHPEVEIGRALATALSGDKNCEVCGVPPSDSCELKMLKGHCPRNIAPSHVGQSGGATPGSYRWINEAVPKLKQLREFLLAAHIGRRADDALDKDCLGCFPIIEIDNMLSGVPCEPQDLGFDSPADRYAKAWHALNAQDFFVTRSASERDKGWHSAQTAPYGKCQKCGIERWQPWPECAEDGCPFAPTERRNKA